MILVAGSANLDFVVRASHIPAAGETVLGYDFQTYSGGKGANQAVACARAGNAATSMLLALGEDAFAAPIEASLSNAGVRTYIVRTRDRSTGTAFICVSAVAENAITVAPGANEILDASHLPPLHGYTHLLLQLEIPLQTVIAYARAAKMQGLTVVLNAAPAQSLPLDLLAAVDVLIVNEVELTAISGRDGDIAHRLERIDVPCVIVTLGARGCWARLAGELMMQQGFPVTPVDTTGAGDTFCGVLTAALSKGLPMAEALRMANAAGALACTRPGAQSSIPTHAELQEFMLAQRAHSDSPLGQ
ncbi:ribokinase [Steroidobacter sp. S1-65]|uniref:Ribokinase n=1 Tax=Steroidobacter gossypii TaxID=2805490 RepID=A0ABS1WVK8_9GAMM|nr:ribokinase [Steroidobacter gossypii]MBM0105016.1 ribokinase [Steroidobacter gossypii]